MFAAVEEDYEEVAAAGQVAHCEFKRHCLSRRRARASTLPACVTCEGQSGDPVGEIRSSEGLIARIDDEEAHGIIVVLPVIDTVRVDLHRI